MGLWIELTRLVRLSPGERVDIIRLSPPTHGPAAESNVPGYFASHVVVNLRSLPGEGEG